MLLKMLHSFSMLQEFHLFLYEAWLKRTNVLEEAPGSISTIKIQEICCRNRRDDKFLLVYMVS